MPKKTPPKVLTNKASKDLPLRGFTNQTCPKSEVFIHWKDKDWSRGGRAKPGSQPQMVTCGGRMMYEMDRQMGEILTCVNCGYVSGPFYGNPVEYEQRRRSASAAGIKLGT